jgi:hypothetical protein
MRLPPSWISSTRPSMSVSSMADTKSRRVSEATECASSGTLNSRISRLTVYLHLRWEGGRRVCSHVTNASVNICRVQEHLFVGTCKGQSSCKVSSSLQCRDRWY